MRLRRDVAQSLFVSLFVSFLSTWAPAVSAAVVRNVTSLHTEDVVFGPAALDDAGTVVHAVSGTNEFGANPRGTPQIVRWDPASGTGAQVTTVDGGVLTVSASDDGQWLAFLSESDPVGSNPDRGAELFVMRSDGTSLAQRTSTPASGGTILEAQISGDGQRIVFIASIDPLGSNATHGVQVFGIGRDGSGLIQLTSYPPGSYEPLSVHVSDDGQHIVYLDPNPSGREQVIAVNADGTNLHALTANTDGFMGTVRISGDGQRIAFSSTGSLGTPNPPGTYAVFVVGWDGTGLALLTPGVHPSITDDGQWIFYRVSSSPSQIGKIRSDGTGAEVLTAGASPVESSMPVVSGDGSRVVFRIVAGAYPGESNPDLSAELMSMDASGGALLQLSSLLSSPLHPSDSSQITADGERIFFKGTDDPSGVSYSSELFRIQSDGTGLARVTNEAPGSAVYELAAASDGSFAVYTLLPGDVLYKINADGSGRAQVSPLTSRAYRPVISRPATGTPWIVFQSNYNGLSNPDGSVELFRRRANLAALGQITNDDDSSYKDPRIDDAGTWVVYHSRSNLDGQNPDHGYEVFRVPVAGGPGLQQRLTADPVYGSGSPDISGDGLWIVWDSSADPLGTNADHNLELFLYEPASATLRQLTFTTDGRNIEPRINQDGSLVYFASSSSFFEPASKYDAYRVIVATGVIERVGGFGVREEDSPYLLWDLSIDRTGSRVVWSGDGDAAGDNPDESDEVWMADYAPSPHIRVGKDAPTLVSWDAEPKPRRYDVIRGQTSSLGPGGGGTVDLGAVVCVEDDSTDAVTETDEDVPQPANGQVFFYLLRGSQGIDDGPGSWGQGSGAAERVAGAGDCVP